MSFAQIDTSSNNAATAKEAVVSPFAPSPQPISIHAEPSDHRATLAKRPSTAIASADCEAESCPRSEPAPFKGVEETAPLPEVEPFDDELVEVDPFPMVEGT